MKASTSLVAEQTGPDNFAWIPRGTISYTSGSCTASIQGSGDVVWAVNLLASFDQLGARCQDGGFNWDLNLYGSLRGVAGWKTSDGEAVSEGYAFKSNGEEEWVRYGTDSVPAYLKGNATTANTILTQRAGRGGSLIKRGPPGTVISTRPVGGAAYVLYRGASVLLDQIRPVLYSLLDDVEEQAGNMINANLQSVGTAVQKCGVSSPNGSTSTSVALVMQLGAEATWKALFQRMNGGETVKDFVWDVLNDFFNPKKLSGGVYHVYDSTGTDVVVSFIVNGVTGTVSGFPG